MSTPVMAEIDPKIKSGTQINEISHKTTLLIITESQSIGSGSLIAKEGNKCIGVTNRHVVLSSEGKVEKMIIRTYDEQTYKVDNVNWFSSEDLAIVEFQCNRNYEPITIATYQLSPGQPVYLSGWPPSLGQINRQFTSGSISTILKNSDDGYAIGYTNVTQGGMSGGQILDAAGRLVGIHGLGDRDQVSAKTGFNYGIPVSTMLARVSQNGLNYNLKIVYSLPQESDDNTLVSTEVPQIDSRDRVDVNKLRDNVDWTIETIQKICIFLGC
ncbi:S1 family peptidase [Crocosphaera chwakensis]|nr:serine protease [Crocosphaera chwakensis]